MKNEERPRPMLRDFRMSVGTIILIILLIAVACCERSGNYGLHEALRLVLLEGLQNRFRRHELCHLALKNGLAELGLDLASQPGHQLWQLNAVAVPQGLDEPGLRKRLLTEFGIEVGAGLGPLKGKVFRVGLMGETSQLSNVERLLNALKICLGR